MPINDDPTRPAIDSARLSEFAEELRRFTERPDTFTPTERSREPATWRIDWRPGPTYGGTFTGRVGEYMVNTASQRIMRSRRAVKQSVSGPAETQNGQRRFKVFFYNEDADEPFAVSEAMALEDADALCDPWIVSCVLPKITAPLRIR